MTMRQARRAVISFLIVAAAILAGNLLAGKAGGIEAAAPRAIFGGLVGSFVITAWLSVREQIKTTFGNDKP